MIEISSIIKEYKLDPFAIILFFLVALSITYGNIYKATIPLIGIVSCIQIYRMLSEKLSAEALLENYFYLIVFSTIFHKSVHNELLIIYLLIGAFLLYEKKIVLRFKFSSEALVFIFFLLIFVNHIVFSKFINGIDTYLYMLFYPLLFFFAKHFPGIIKPIKAINVYITSILVASFILIILNLIDGNINLETNTYFAKYLGLTHVYYGMFIGLAISFLFVLIIYKRTFLNPFMDLLIFIFFLITLILIGSRIALIAVLIVFTIVLFKKIRLKWYIKSAVLLVVLAGLFFATIKLIPRVKDDIKYAQNVYSSIKNNNNEDIVHNSWRNMYQRYLVLKYTKTEIKKHPFIGIGLPNVRDQVSSKILSDGYLYFQPLNTHNQYLHFLVALGIFGFLFFLLILLHFYRKLIHHQMGLVFIIFFVIIMLTESILVRAKGISLFFLFAFILSQKENYIKFE